MMCTRIHLLTFGLRRRGLSPMRLALGVLVLLFGTFIAEASSRNNLENDGESHGNSTISAQRSTYLDPEMQKLMTAIAKKQQSSAAAADTRSGGGIAPAAVDTSCFGTGLLPDFLGIGLSIGVTVCAPLAIALTTPLGDVPIAEIPGSGGCSCADDGDSSLGFYFQPFGDFSIGVEVGGEVDIIIAGGNAAANLGASLAVGTCKWCPRGTYQPEASFNCEGLDSCKFCPAGHVPTAFKILPSDGIDGVVLEQEGASTCFKCAPGTFSNGDGQVGVLHPDDSTSATCCPCVAGTFAPQFGATECTDCAAGTFQPEEGQPGCSLCPVGTFATGGGATSCEACLPGTFAPNEGREECTDCAAGTFQREAGQAGCDLCPAGTFTNGGGATSCDECSPGTFSPNPAAETCLLCPKGTFTRRFGSSRCTKCPFALTKQGSRKCTASKRIDASLEDGDYDLNKDYYGDETKHYDERPYRATHEVDWEDDAVPWGE